VVHTLWGELAWQLGGKKAYARIKADDEKATKPRRRAARAVQRIRPLPDSDRRVGGLCAPAARPERSAGGGFETQFTFAQVLTESAKLAKNCLLVISLPASDTSGSPHTQADDVEVGGTRARGAGRLRNVVGGWSRRGARRGRRRLRDRAAAAVRAAADPAQFKDRDVVARAFADFYRTQQAEFPPSAATANTRSASRRRTRSTRKIFDRLYTDWSTLVKFQRTRGVLRLMAAVIHSLWEKGDRNPLILPGNVADRRPARAVRIDALPLGQLGAGHREGCGRAELAAAEAGQRIAQPGQVLGLPAGGARHLHGFGAHHGRRAQGHRGSR
jgi:hypothetical protein